MKKKIVSAMKKVWSKKGYYATLEHLFWSLSLSPVLFVILLVFLSEPRGCLYRIYINAYGRLSLIIRKTHGPGNEVV